MSDFAELMTLLELLGDPAKYKARLEELRTATAAMDESTAEAQVEQQNLAGERARLAKLESDIRAREVAAGHSELKQAADLATIEAFKRDQRASRLVQHRGGLTSEPDDTPDAPDPISDRYAPAMHEALRGNPRPRATRVRP